MMSSFIRPGTTIVTDYFGAYLGLPMVEVSPRDKHVRINHSKEFVQSDGFHSNNIEAMWASLKLKIPKKRRNKKFLQGSLFEQMWRSKNKGHLWEALLIALKKIEYN